ncbi:unnamed protein product [Ixodes persulcatus]
MAAMQCGVPCLRGLPFLCELLCVLLVCAVSTPTPCVNKRPRVPRP